MYSYPELAKEVLKDPNSGKSKSIHIASTGSGSNVAMSTIKLRKNPALAGNFRLSSIK